MIYNKELSDETIKALSEFASLFGRLKESIAGNNDPFTILSVFEDRLKQIDRNLLNILAGRNSVFLQDYAMSALKQEGVQAHFVLPEYGVPIRLMSALTEIITVIFRKFSERTFMVHFQGYENGHAISVIIRNIKLEEIQTISLVKAISTLDGVLAANDDNSIRITLPNVFGREKFITVGSNNGIVAFPAVSINGYEKILAENNSRKQELEICLGADRMKFKAQVIGLEFCLRSYPRLPVPARCFKGVILAKTGMPVPVINITELFNEGVFEWLC